MEVADTLFGVPLDTLATGLSVIIVALAVSLGKIFGKRDKEKPNATMELAGAVIDGKQAKELGADFKLVAEALKENARASINTAKGMPAIIDALDELKRSVESFGKDNEKGVGQMVHILDSIEKELIQIRIYSQKRN